ncbi:hypothetical protein [Streptomyces sp. GQFP]|uniref:hypothetical protein n=1 Tax=Streptomyces sp. GQFP TaxID=2907545 RepID=UPI001F3B1629|nr:hypothetical protein [Streptomyces sp. GQFP]UIX33168.1 hypothetical protein LUX31_25895 [Streptomyces sp. GQFP]
MPDGSVAELTLLVEDFAGPDHWRWALVAPDDEILARHEVRLDPTGPLYEAFHLPGAGKTACARELVATHAHAFERTVWFTAPQEQDHHQYEEAVLACLHLLETADGSATEFMAAVSAWLERERVLLVDQPSRRPAAGACWRWPWWQRGRWRS